jgi:3D (Asp-Asp-Asp) domain-containing protein
MKQFKQILLGSAAFLSIAGFSLTVNADQVEHTVRSHDTLSNISIQYFGDASYVNKIAQDNNISNPDIIFDGQQLKINTDGSAEVSAPATTTEATEAAEVQADTQTEAQPEQTTQSPSGRTLTMESTAYSSDPADTLGGGTVTATGQNLLSNPMAVAVDPNVIPLGTRLYVEGYGEAIASDTGGAIQGNIVDVHFSTYAECIAWGRRTVQVTILD